MRLPAPELLWVSIPPPDSPSSELKGGGEGEEDRENDGEISLAAFG